MSRSRERPAGTGEPDPGRASDPHGEDPPLPARRAAGDPGADAGACERFRGSLGAYLAGRLEPGETRALREHAGRCAPCNELLRNDLLVAARMGRRLRREREDRERRERRSESRRLAVAGATERARRPRRFALRLLLLPAVLFALLLNTSDLGLGRGATATFRPLRGTAHAGGEPVDLAGERRVRRGDWCGTDEDSGARLRSDALTVELGPSTWLLVEDPRAGRLRLERGELLVDGRGTVTSPLGVVVVGPGRARLTLAESALDVRALEGTVRTADAAGERELAPGQARRLPLDG